MKFKKSVLKSLLKESLLELIEEGAISFHSQTVQEVKVATRNTNDQNTISENIKNTLAEYEKIKRPQMQNQTRQNIPQKPKSITGNPMLDQIISEVKDPEIVQNQSAIQGTNVPMEDYSKFIENI